MKNTDSIKLLHVASSHRLGLTNQETQLALAYNALPDLDISVLSGEMEQFAGCFSELEATNIPVVRIVGFDEHHDLKRLIREFTIAADNTMADIVSVNTNWQLLVAGLARLFAKKNYKIIYTIHGFRNNHFIKSFVARFFISVLLFVFADKINAPSTYVRKKFNLLSYKMRSIPLGEDETFFRNSKLPDFSKRLAFCFPGQFRPGKNQILLIKAFAEYINQTSDSNSILILPGEGELLSKCKVLAEKKGITRQVFFPGQVDRPSMMEIYQLCQITLVASNVETFGHCIAEPLVMKRIIISRSVGIASDVITHGINGFLYSTYQELVSLMVSLRHMDNNQLEEISKQAGITAEHFSWRKVSEQYLEDLIKPVLSKPKSRRNEVV
ncbi:MAG: glycosyltransferase family 4 protein [Legionellaceae bacterium]|nr:glycosyltransferase family 4 protein [Legionellaceae bacterium]